MPTLYGFATELATTAVPLANANHDDEGWIFGLSFGLLFMGALIAVVMLLMRGQGWFDPKYRRGNRDRGDGDGAEE